MLTRNELIIGSISVLALLISLVAVYQPRLKGLQSRAYQISNPVTNVETQGGVSHTTDCPENFPECDGPSDPQCYAEWVGWKNSWADYNSAVATGQSSLSDRFARVMIYSQSAYSDCLHRNDNM